MLEFKNIEEKDIEIISNYIYNNNILSSAYSIYNLYELRKKYNTRVAYKDETLFIQQTNRDNDLLNTYLFPIGNMKLCNSINLLYEHAQSENKNMMLWGLSSKMTDELKLEIPDIYEFKEIINWFDYIYSKEKLVNCKMLKKGRKFVKEYENIFKIEKISEQNLDLIIRFQHKWMEENRANNADIISLNYENNSIMETLNNWGKIPLNGYCIIINNNVVGYTYGFKQTEDCFTIHVIKADKRIKGLTLFLFKYIVESVNTKYINFEEDIGIEGLKIFKSRLEPSFLLNKYKTEINNYKKS